ncbi:hypothetical protein VNO78_22590 [Psophocarpus tetragonolobus]|uniref:Peptidase A1 domain-containing protein n=1 Tax=Psophocarpus tetragonolobus TaxID=3891 RepID=A0AAN9S288_PSOTE
MASVPERKNNNLTLWGVARHKKNPDVSRPTQGWKTEDKKDGYWKLEIGNWKLLKLKVKHSRDRERERERVLFGAKNCPSWIGMGSFTLLVWVMTVAVAVGHPDSSFLIKVAKDADTLQYLTTLSYGTPLVATKVVVDLGGPFLWVHCGSRSTPSSSSLSTPSSSSLSTPSSSSLSTPSSSSLSTPSSSSLSTPSSSSLSTPSSSSLSTPDRSLQWLTHHWSTSKLEQACQVFPANSITGMMARDGELVEDLVALESAQSGQVVEHQTRFACSPKTLLNGLAKGARGMLGLARSHTSLPSQLFHNHTYRKLTLCLSSSNGLLLLGSLPTHRILKSLTFTPLVSAFPSKYFITVNSIKINGKRLSSSSSPSPPTLTLLSTIVPYTTMHTSLYNSFKTAFEDAALAINITRVASVPPFDLCFTSTAPHTLPVIELVLQSDMVKWSIHGRNSLVRVTDKVHCLAFFDGGANPANPIVLGGYQLEDVLLQFDLPTSMLGFSASLLTQNTKCSHFISAPAYSI